MSSGDIFDIMSCAIFIISGFIMAGFIGFVVGAWAATGRVRSLATRLRQKFALGHTAGGPEKSRNKNKQQVRVW